MLMNLCDYLFIYFLSKSSWSIINVIINSKSVLGSEIFDKESSHRDIPLHIQLELTQDLQVGNIFRNKRKEF